MTSSFINDIHDIQYILPHMDKPMYVYVGQQIAGVEITAIEFDHNMLKQYKLIRITVFATKDGEAEFAWKNVLYKLNDSLGSDKFFIITNSDRNKATEYELES